MASPAPYIPAKRALLDTWSQNFSTLLTANPPLYGLVVADAVTVAAFVLSFHSAYLAAKNPGTRTPPNVAAQDAAQAAMLGVCRGYAIQIRNNAGVSNSDKVNLGLTVPTLTPTPVPSPVTNPVLGILGATPLQLTCKFADATTPTKKAKPAGAFSLEVHAVASPTVVSDPNAIPYVKDVTVTPFALNFASGDVGKPAYIVARWKTRRGLVGPWSSIVSMTVAA